MSGKSVPAWVTDLVKKTKRGVPAYDDFLRKERVQQLNDFYTLPLITKTNYIKKYSLEMLVPRGKIPPYIYASSGSSGRPTFWYLDKARQDFGVDVHEELVKKTFGISRKDKTLVVVCFSMGLWVAGVYTADSFKGLSLRGFNITVVTPGISKEDIIHILKEVGPDYDNIILAGYPTFLMDVIKLAKIRRISFNPHKTFFLLAGDKVSEKWKKDLINRVSLKPSKGVEKVVTAYGCAELTVIGMETQASVGLRRLALSDSSFYKQLLGEKVASEPGVYEFDPDFLFVESIEGELVFTADTAIPLIRYNIRDIGTVFYPEEVIYMLDKNKHKKIVSLLQKNNQKPFIVIKGRNDVATTFYALNILPEQIHTVLRDLAIRRFVSGNFALYNKFVYNNKKERLCFDVELSEGQKKTPDLVIKIKDAFVKNLSRVSVEYRKLHGVIGEQADPIIKIYKKGEPGFLHGKKGLLYINGSKPKIII